MVPGRKKCTFQKCCRGLEATVDRYSFSFTVKDLFMQKSMQRISAEVMKRKFDGWYLASLRHQWHHPSVLGVGGSVHQNYFLHILNVGTSGSGDKQQCWVWSCSKKSFLQGQLQVSRCQMWRFNVKRTSKTPWNTGVIIIMFYSHFSTILWLDLGESELFGPKKK